MNALSDVHGHAAFWVLAGITFASELGVPIPVLPTALFVGACAVRGSGDFLLLAGGIVAASLIANIGWFTAGRRYGADVLKLCRFSGESDASAARARQAFERWGSVVLVVGRFVPALLWVATPLAGATGMSAVRFVAVTTLGAVTYAMAVLGAGFLMREQIGPVLLALRGFGLPLIIVTVLMLAACIVWCCWRRHSLLALHPGRTSTIQRR